jgi:glycosyltransferase involved in cell wall biosynthesis
MMGSASAIAGDGVPGLVSVIVPVFNAAAFVEQTIRSVLAQTYQAFEIIVIDDGSTDSTLDVVRNIGGPIRILGQPNSGVCVARNTAAREARGEFLAFLDSDDVWEPEKLAKQVSVFREHPDVAVVATWHDEIDQVGRPLTREMKQPRSLMDRPVGLHRVFLKEGNFLSVSACLIRREAFMTAGGFHVRERILSGDYDLWIRLSEYHKFFVLSDALTHYRILENSQIHGSFAKEYGAQLNILRMHRHRFGRWEFRRRLSTLHRDWADSALFDGDPEGWRTWRHALRLNPINASLWLLGARVAAKRSLQRLHVGRAY